MKKLSHLTLALVLATSLALVGCSDDDDDSAGSGTALTSEDTFETGDEPLDAAQSALYDNLAGSAAGTPGEDFVLHLTYALNYLIEGPDQLLHVLGTAANDPDAIGDIGPALLFNLQAFVAELSCALGSPLGQPCLSLGTAPDPSLYDLQPTLEALQEALSGGEGADLSVILFHLRRLAEGLAVSITNLEGGADAPLYTPLLETLRQAVLDVADLLDTIQIVGGGDGDALSGLEANEALRITLENLLVNLFTNVIPLSEQDPDTAQQVIDAIHDGMDRFEEYFANLVVPIVDDILDPVTDIIGPILDSLLHELGIEG